MIKKRRLTACIIGRRYIYTIPSVPCDRLISAVKNLGRCRKLTLGNFQTYFVDNKYFILQLTNEKAVIDGRFKRSVWEDGVKEFEKFISEFYSMCITEVD